MARITHAPSYLVRNRYSYCFRIRVPQDLQNHLGKKELRYSLATGYLSEAKFKARVAAGLVQILFRELRKLQMKSTEKQIQGIAAGHLKQLVESLTGPKPPLSGDMEPLIAALALKKKLESLSCDKFQIVVDMNTGRYKDVIQLLPDILADHGIDFENVDKEDSSIVQLCRGNPSRARRVSRQTPFASPPLTLNTGHPPAEQDFQWGKASASES